MKPVTAVIIGAGSRGSGYAVFQLDFPHRFKVVGVADPKKIRVKKIQKWYNIPDENTFSDWSEFIKRDKFADAVIIATPDILHKAPAVACANKGYHILLEKPMAVTEEDCRQIAQACERNNVMLAVCHVLRYDPSLMKVKTNNASHISTGPQDALASHLLVFAAEKARRENRIITINEDYTYQ